MGQRKKLRDIVGAMKDRGSLVKASLSRKPAASATRATVLRATTHKSAAAPSERRVAAVLSLGLGSGITASACIRCLAGRLGRTRNAFVALKCLFALHSIMIHRSSRDENLCLYSLCFEGKGFLNLPKFNDDFDEEAMEYSSWVRWYAALLEQSLIASRALGYVLSSSSSSSSSSSCSQLTREYKREKMRAAASSDLMRELEVLVTSLEQVCDAPGSLHLQRNDLVYGVVRSVCQDYRMIRCEVFSRVEELGGDERLGSSSPRHLTRLLSALERVEDCREKLALLFVNKANADGLWDLIARTKTKMRGLMRDGGRSSTAVLGGGGAWLPWRDRFSANAFTAVW
ncbi:putative clathrin assembly protein At4g40080 [Syzygium oleosum]|uniref:putative clathrin assembly protein At4g40080 n=1 Tax=Syzygium oleosum TaxID=219896 RepID=UPI0024BA5E02|nr:putative clathrin assembly protein At4g40080 [Syzygium oleosum]